MPDLTTRPHDVRGLTACELDRTRRDLRASLALVRPDSPARVPILAHLNAIDAELTARGTGAGSGEPAQGPGARDSRDTQGRR